MQRAAPHGAAFLFSGIQMSSSAKFSTSRGRAERRFEIFSFIELTAVLMFARAPRRTASSRCDSDRPYSSDHAAAHSNPISRRWSSVLALRILSPIDLRFGIICIQYEPIDYPRGVFLADSGKLFQGFRSLWLEGDVDMPSARFDQGGAADRQARLCFAILMLPWARHLLVPVPVFSDRPQSRKDDRLPFETGSFAPVAPVFPC